MLIGWMPLHAPLVVATWGCGVRHLVPFPGLVVVHHRGGLPSTQVSTMGALVLTSALS